jgi:hypothetical protein
MAAHVDRKTVDLAAYPDLVVIYLGMRVRWMAGVKTLSALMRGGMEAIYDDVSRPPLGFQAFAPTVPARGPMLAARTRLGLPGEVSAHPAGVDERDLY